MRQSIRLIVDGMHCDRCVQSVRTLLQAVPGVLEVDVTLDPGAAVVAYDLSLCPPDALRRAIENAGFDVR